MMSAGTFFVVKNIINKVPLFHCDFSRSTQHTIDAPAEGVLR